MKYFVGQPVELYEEAIVITIAVLSALLCIWQIIYLQHLKILPSYLLPFISFFICFENLVISRGTTVGAESLVAYFTYVFHSFQSPLLIIVLYETAYRLHETRAVHFFCFPFDQGYELQRTLALASVWCVRLIAAGLFVMNIIADFHLVKATDDDSRNIGGHAYLANNKNSVDLWLGLIPVIVLSIFALLVSNVMYRYGNNLTFGLVGKHWWKLFVPCALAQVVGHIFYPEIYLITSNIGEVLLLFGATFLLHLVQKELGLAGSFADFLHRSNIAFDKARVDIRESHIRDSQGHPHHSHPQHHLHHTQDRDSVGLVGSSSSHAQPHHTHSATHRSLNSGMNAKYRAAGDNQENVVRSLPIPSGVVVAGIEDRKDDEEKASTNDVEAAATAAMMSGDEVVTTAGVDDVNIELVDKPSQEQ